MEGGTGADSAEVKEGENKIWNLSECKWTFPGTYWALVLHYDLILPKFQLSRDSLQFDSLSSFLVFGAQDSYG